MKEIDNLVTPTCPVGYWEACGPWPDYSVYGKSRPIASLTQDERHGEVEVEAPAVRRHPQTWKYHGDTASLL